MSNNFQLGTHSNHECDECLIKGICTVNSTLTSLQEIILLHLKELSFYVLRLKNFGITNDSLKDMVLYAIFNIVTNTEYNQEKFQHLLTKLDSSINQSKMLYEKACSEKNVPQESPKTYFKRGKNLTLTDAIRKGEKYFLKKSQTFSQEQKIYFDIMLFLIKSLTLKTLEAKSLEINYEDPYYEILSLLNVMNIISYSKEQIEAEIGKFIDIYYQTNKSVFLKQLEKYGEISECEVSLSTYEGKAILVSGSDYTILENVLKSVEKTDINVYTHGLEMLMAHSFPKLRNHKNLKGHFGSSTESSMIDFATFPGAILMTKGALQKVEYLYRGRLFTLDPIAPMGVIKLNAGDFEPLIKSAQDAKGFTKTTQRPNINVGFERKKVKEEINHIIDKIIDEKIKYINIIGLSNVPNAYGEYFKTLTELIDGNTFTISLSYKTKKDYFYHLDSFCDYTLFYTILKEIETRMPLENLNLSIFIPKCDKHIISNLLYLKKHGVKNIYMCKCPPSLVNPMLMTLLEETYEIKELNDAAANLKEILSAQGG